MIEMDLTRHRKEIDKSIDVALAESYYDGYNRALQDIAQNEQKLDYCLPDILQKIIPEKYSTNAELSKATGISQSALHHYVHGTRIPTAKNLYKLSQALGVSADYLLTGGVNT